LWVGLLLAELCLLDVLLVVGLASVGVADWADVVKDGFLEPDVEVRFAVLAGAVSNTDELDVPILLEVSIASDRKDWPNITYLQARGGMAKLDKNHATRASCISPCPPDDFG
jgi:hypothetical protein